MFMKYIYNGKDIESRTGQHCIITRVEPVDPELVEVKFDNGPSYWVNRRDLTAFTLMDVLHRPAPLRFVDINVTFTKPWKVDDECWVSNEAGHGVEDDAFDMIGEDLTLKILSIYDNGETPCAVLQNVKGGANRCFRLDMLRPHKSKRGKTIDAIDSHLALNFNCTDGWFTKKMASMVFDMATNDSIKER